MTAGTGCETAGGGVGGTARWSLGRFDCAPFRRRLRRAFSRSMVLSSAMQSRRLPYGPIQRYEALPADERLYVDTKFLQVRDVAALLQANERNVRTWIDEGRMRTLRLNRVERSKHLVPASEVMRFMDGHFPAFQPRGCTLPVLPTGPLWRTFTMRQRVAAYMTILEPEEAAWRLAGRETGDVWALVRDGLLRARRTRKRCRFVVVAADLADFIGRQAGTFVDFLRAS